MSRAGLFAAWAALALCPISANAQVAASASAKEAAIPAPEARPPVIPTSDFSSRNDWRNSVLSPDGNRIATQVEVDGETLILVIDAVTFAPVRKFGTGKDKIALEWFRWAGNDRVLLGLSAIAQFMGEDARFTRLYSLNINDGALQLVGRKAPVVTGDDVVYIAPDGSWLLLSIQASIYDYPSVYRFDLTGDSRETRVVSSREGIWNWIADDQGVVRIGTGWSMGKYNIIYRKSGADKWATVGKFKPDDPATRLWDVMKIIGGSDLGYILDEGKDGRVELQQFDYAKREVVKTVYANPEWDVEQAWLGQDDEPLAASFTDDRDRIVWFRDADKKLQAMLDKSMVEDEAWITSRARDGSRMLIWAGGEADPGALYVYTPAQNRMVQFAEMRPKIRFIDLVKPKSVQYDARDGTKISAYLTLPRGRVAKNLPLILLPHGGPYGIRDKLDYNDEVQLLANRGYAVLQPNYRGSGGYGKGFADLGIGQIGRKMQDDLDDATDWAVAQGIADANRVCVVGGSYGGYAALWAVLRNPERYRCAASWAGVTDWDSQLRYDRNYFSRSAGKKWRARIQGDQEGFDLDSVSPYRQAGTLSRPILVGHGTDDTNVPFSQFKKMRTATATAKVPVDLLVIEDEGHSFTKPENEQRWYDALLAFLAKNNPAD